MKLTMTRVLTPLAALAITFGVQAAAVSTDGFEAETSTAPGSRTGWSFTAGQDNAADASAVTAYGEAAKPSNLPDGRTAGDNFLKLSTEDGILFRNMDNASGADVQIPDAGLFVDTDVQFTLTDSTDRPTPVSADKFIIWLEAKEATGAEEGYTNLCVYGGCYTYDSSANPAIARTAQPVVYKLSGVNIAPGSWHRLTVKAVRQLSSAFAHPGFEVYIDGIQMASAEYFFGGETTFADLNGFNSVIGDDAWNALDAKTFFPSLVENISSLSQIGFSGEGKIDEVVVTKDIPGFLPAAGLTVTWDNTLVSSVAMIGQTLTESGSLVTIATNSTLTILKTDLTAATGVDLANYDMTVTSSEPGVAAVSAVEDGFMITPTGAQLHGTATIAITLTANNTGAVTFSLAGLLTTLGAQHLSDLQSISYSIGELTGTITSDFANYEAIGPGTVTVNDTFTFTVTLANGWIATFDDDVEGVTRSGNTFTLTTRGPKDIAVSAIKPAATVNGTAYETFAEALAAAAKAGTATIQLASDVTLDATATIAADKDIIIDLNGKTITGAASVPVFTVEFDGALTVTNSAAADGFVIADANGSCIANAGTLNLQAGKFNGAISGGKINVTGGAFTADITGATCPAGYALAQDTSLTTYQWVLAAQSYNVYYYDGETALTGLQGTYTYGTGLAALAAGPEKADHTFNGWYDNSGLTGDAVTSIAADATGDKTFYAKYTEDTSTTTPVAPGEQDSTEYDTEAAATADAGNIVITPTAAVAAVVGDGYAGMFEVKAVQKANGKWVLEVDLKAADKANLQTQANNDAATIAVGITGSSVTIATTPGFYYSLKSGTTLDNMTEGTRELADGATKTFTLPKSGTAGFYQVLINVTAE